MELCALALDLPEDFFAAKVDRQISGLRLRNYPAPDPAAPPPRPGQLRVGPHSDFVGLTILKPEADVAGGLQVLSSGSEDQWEDVPYVEGGYVINLGKLMARWTNDRWRATVRTSPFQAPVCFEKSDHFAKTGSGQTNTYGKLKPKRVSLLAGPPRRQPPSPVHSRGLRRNPSALNDLLPQPKLRRGNRVYSELRNGAQRPFCVILY